MDGNADSEHIQISPYFFRNKKPWREGAKVYYGYQQFKNGKRRPVTIKMIDTYRKKHLRKVKRLARFRHPNIIETIAAIKHEGHMYIVMEHFKPSNMQSFLDKDMYFLKNSCKTIAWTKQLIDAMQYIYYKGFTVENLTPRRVFFFSDGRDIKVSLFAIEENLQENDLLLVGSYRNDYQAPEMLNSTTLTQKSNIFTLGTILATLWSYGIHPFGEGVISRMYNIMTNQSRPLLAFFMDASKADEFYDLIRWMLQPDPELRPTIDQVAGHPFFNSQPTMSAKGVSQAEDGTFSQNLTDDILAEKLDSPEKVDVDSYINRLQNAPKQEMLAIFREIFELRDKAQSEIARSIRNADFSGSTLSLYDVHRIGSITNLSKHLDVVNFSSCSLQPGALRLLKDTLTNDVPIDELQVTGNPGLMVSDLCSGFDLCAEIGCRFVYDSMHLSKMDHKKLKNYIKEYQVDGEVTKGRDLRAKETISGATENVKKVAIESSFTVRESISSISDNEISKKDGKDESSSSSSSDSEDEDSPTPKAEEHRPGVEESAIGIRMVNGKSLEVLTDALERIEGTKTSLDGSDSSSSSKTCSIHGSVEDIHKMNEAEEAIYRNAAETFMMEEKLDQLEHVATGLNQSDPRLIRILDDIDAEVDMAEKQVEHIKHEGKAIDAIVQELRGAGLQVGRGGFKRTSLDSAPMRKKDEKTTWCSRRSHRCSTSQHATIKCEECNNPEWRTDVNPDPVPFRNYPIYPQTPYSYVGYNPVPDPYQGNHSLGNTQDGFARPQNMRPSTFPAAFPSSGIGDANYAITYPQNPDLLGYNMNSPRDERTKLHYNRTPEPPMQGFTNNASSVPVTLEYSAPPRSTASQSTVSQPHTCLNVTSVLSTVVTTAVIVNTTSHSTHADGKYMSWGSGHRTSSTTKPRQFSTISNSDNGGNDQSSNRTRNETQKLKNRNRSQSGDVNNSMKQPWRKTHGNTQNIEPLQVPQLRTSTSAPSLVSMKEEQTHSSNFKEGNTRKNGQFLRKKEVVTVTSSIPKHLKPLNVSVNVIPKNKKEGSKPKGGTCFRLKVEWSDGTTSECDHSVEDIVKFYKKVSAGKIGKKAKNTNFVTKQNNQILERRKLLEGIFHDFLSSTLNGSNIEEFMTFFKYNATATPAPSSLPFKKRIKHRPDVDVYIDKMRSVPKHEMLALFQEVCELTAEAQSRIAQSIRHADFSGTALSLFDVQLISSVVNLTEHLSLVNLSYCNLQPGSLRLLENTVANNIKIDKLQVTGNFRLLVSDLCSGIDLCARIGCKFVYDNKHLSKKEHRKLRNHVKEYQLGGETSWRDETSQEGSSKSRKTLMNEERFQKWYKKYSGTNARLQRLSLDFNVGIKTTNDEVQDKRADDSLLEKSNNDVSTTPSTRQVESEVVGTDGNLEDSKKLSGTTKNLNKVPPNVEVGSTAEYKLDTGLEHQTTVSPQERDTASQNPPVDHEDTGLSQFAKEFYPIGRNVEDSDIMELAGAAIDLAPNYSQGDIYKLDQFLDPRKLKNSQNPETSSMYSLKYRMQHRHGFPDLTEMSSQTSFDAYGGRSPTPPQPKKQVAESETSKADARSEPVQETTASLEPPQVVETMPTPHGFHKKKTRPLTLGEIMKLKPVVKFEKILKTSNEERGGSLAETRAMHLRKLKTMAMNSDRRRFESVTLKPGKNIRRYISSRLEASTAFLKSSKGDSGYRTQSSFSEAMSCKSSLRRFSQKSPEVSDTSFLDAEGKESIDSTKPASLERIEEVESSVEKSGRYDSGVEEHTHDPNRLIEQKFEMTLMGLGTMEKSRKMIESWFEQANFDEQPQESGESFELKSSARLSSLSIEKEKSVLDGDSTIEKTVEEVLEDLLHQVEDAMATVHAYRTFGQPGTSRQEFVNTIDTEMERSYKQKAYKTEEIGPEGDHNLIEEFASRLSALIIDDFVKEKVVSSSEDIVKAVVEELLQEVEFAIHGSSFRQTDVELTQDRIADELREPCKKSFKTEEILPEGGSIELYGCGIIFPPSAVKKKTEWTMPLDSNLGSFPESATAISPILECKPSEFKVPVSMGHDPNGVIEKKLEMTAMGLGAMQNRREMIQSWMMDSEFSLPTNQSTHKRKKVVSSSENIVKAVVEELLQEVEFAIHGSRTLGLPLTSRQELVNTIYAEMERSCKHKSYKTEEIGPEGGSIELYGCEILFPPGAVKKRTKVRISVDIDPDNFPKFATAISPILGCKPSRFRVPVVVRLTTWFSAKNGEKIQVTIMSKLNLRARWKEVKTVLLDDQNMVEYEVKHFCGHVTTVPNERASQGVYHLINDVWMHSRTANIISFFCKDEKALKKGRKDVKTEHKRISSLRGEISASLGNAIVIELQCNKPPPPPPAMAIASVDKNNGRLEINARTLQRNLCFLGFQPIPHPEEMPHVKLYDVRYNAEVYDSNGPLIDQGFSTALNFYWPLVPATTQRNAGEASTGINIGTVSTLTMTENTVTVGGRHQGGASQASASSQSQKK